VLSLECVGTIQRLHWAQKWSLRKVAKHSCISRKTVKKSLFSPPHFAPRSAVANRILVTVIAEFVRQDQPFGP
jgi:hypothetical protein